MTRLVVVLAIVLAGCAHAAARDVVTYAPTPVACVPPELGPEPTALETRQALAAVPDGPERYVRLAADWLRRVARMDETEPIIKACREAALPPPH